MDFKLLKASILQNNIPKFLIFVAEEPALCRQYLKSISSTVGLKYKFYNTADEVLYETSTHIFDENLYVILNDDKILKNTKYIDELIKLDRNVILYFTEFDTKSEIYKQYKDYFVIFNKLDKYTLVAYLNNLFKTNKIEVAQEKVELLVDYCDCDFGCCLNEADKIISLEQSNSNALFDYMLNNGFSDYRETNMFKFIQKILNKDATLFDDQLRLNESLIGLLTNLHRQASFRLAKATQATEQFYGKIMQLCTEIDCGIKDGTITDKSALDYLLLEVFRDA